MSYTLIKFLLTLVILSHVSSMVWGVPVPEVTSNVTTSAPTVATRETCNGTHERLIQLGGGCTSNVDGIAICGDPKPPTCECVEGFERSPSSKQCESTEKKECNGPHEHWIQIGGGCYRPTPNSPAICLPPLPRECVCETGYERNPLTQLCEAIVLTNSKKRN